VASSKTQDRSNLILPLAIVAALIPLIGAAWWYLERGPRQTVPPALTPEAKAYVKFLQLANVEMRATANYTGATIIEITGQITNAGDRTLRQVALNCVFYDVSGLVVLRERTPIVKSLLKPGETQNFRLPFEGLSENWNRAMPQLVIAHILFE